MTYSEVGKWALKYAEKNFFVFPVKPKDKTPLTINGFKDSSIDPEQIKKWWTQWPDANIGIDIEKSKVMLVDPDRHQNKVNGVKEFRKLRGNNPLPYTPISKTGSGGFHLIFKRQEDKLKSKIGQSIDIKTNGYFIAPPSIHPNGNKYEWKENYSILNMQPAECPAWLLNYIIVNKESTEVTRNKDYPLSSGELIPQRCAFIKHCVEEAGNLPEQYWTFGTIGILSYTVEAPEIVHRYSNEHTDYSYKETQYKINHFQESSLGPTTCEKIQDKCGDEYCLDCPYNGKIKSPIILGYVNKASNDTAENAAFPIEELPNLFKRYSLEASEAIGCPICYISCALLAFAAGLIGTSRKVRLRPEWEQFCNLWIMLVGRPASKKSPALNAISKFIDDIEKQNYKDYEREKLLYELEKVRYENDYNNWKIKAVSTPPEKPKQTILKTITTNNTTVEALCELLSNNSAGITIVNDELSAWLRSMNQYKGGGGSDRSDYLSMWNAQRMTVNRKGKEPLSIDNAFLNIIGCIQPEILQEMNSNK